jgi:hypothetical protein
MSEVIAILFFALALYLVVIGVTVRNRARRALFDLGVLILAADQRLDQARDPQALKLLLERADANLKRAQLYSAAGHPSMALSLASATHYHLLVALEEQGFKVPF